MSFITIDLEFVWESFGNSVCMLCNENHEKEIVRKANVTGGNAYFCLHTFINIQFGLWMIQIFYTFTTNLKPPLFCCLMQMKDNF